MEITKEMFNELPQLDRIEFRQKQDRIKEAFGETFSVAYYLMWAYLLFLFGACLLTSSLFGYQAAQTIFIKIADWVNVAIAIILVGFFYDIYKMILKKKVFGELNKEYFKVNLKNGRKRKR